MWTPSISSIAVGKTTLDTTPSRSEAAVVTCVDKVAGEGQVGVDTAGVGRGGQQVHVAAVAVSRSARRRRNGPVVPGRGLGQVVSGQLHWVIADADRSAINHDERMIERGIEQRPTNVRLRRVIATVLTGLVLVAVPAVLVALRSWLPDEAFKALAARTRANEFTALVER